MTRRDLLAAGAAVALAGFAVPSFGEPGKRMIVPKALREGSKVALVSPASATGDPSGLTEAEAFLTRLGYTPVRMPHVGGKWAYFGGTDEERAADIMTAFEDPLIDGVWAVRGGWGCARILDKLDYGFIRRHAKVLIGYSDLTALLNAVTEKSGVVTYHGPVAVSSVTEFSDTVMKSVLEGGVVSYQAPDNGDPDFLMRAMRAGQGEGELAGGNLAILASLCGTPWQVNGKGKILFLEDVSEAPYRIDRMLTQLRQAGCFEGCRGVLAGQFTKAEDPEEESAWSVLEVLEDRLGDLDIPVITGCPIGHVKDKWTLPIGIRARMDAGARTLGLVGAAVGA